MIRGDVRPGWEAVRDAFALNFEIRSETGAGVSVIHRGQRVVDLWGGSADLRHGRPWEADTIVLVMSTTKAWVGAAVLKLADHGHLDVDEPVTNWWPEFAAGGKHGAYVRHLLAHECGLPGWDDDLLATDLLDWDRCVSALEQQRPWWPPGGGVGYHARTFGFLCGELVRRADPQHRSVGTFVREELGADLHIGVAAGAWDRVARVSEVETGAGPADSGPLAERVFGRPAMSTATWNMRSVLASEIPAVNGVTSARALASFYGQLVDGEVISGALLDRALEEEVAGDDLVRGCAVRYGMGFALPVPADPLGGVGTFGYAGSGGSLGFGHLDAQLGVGFVTNGFQEHGIAEDPRRLALVAAIRSCAGC